MSSVAPRVVRLETARLELRLFRPDDLAAFAAMNADPEVMRHIGDGRPHDGPWSKDTFERMRWHWAEHGFGRWAIERASDGAFLGFCGVGFPMFVPEVATRPEIGWRLGREFWGKGYATEAAIAARDHFFRTFGWPELISLAKPANVASHRVMRKLGMRRVDDLATAAEGPLAVHQLDRTDWRTA
jgi:RimJ/RimL family protein N-acetyltransferase